MRVEIRWMIGVALLAGSVIAAPANAENECDCEQHDAGASGPGACSISESSSYCSITYENAANSWAWQQLVFDQVRLNSESEYKDQLQSYAERSLSQFDLDSKEHPFVRAVMWSLSRTPQELQMGMARPNQIRQFVKFALPAALTYSAPERNQEIYLEVFGIFAQEQVTRELQDDMERFFTPHQGGSPSFVEGRLHGLARRVPYRVGSGCFAMELEGTVMRIETPGGVQCLMKTGF